MSTVGRLPSRRPLSFFIVSSHLNRTGSHHFGRLGRFSVAGPTLLAEPGTNRRGRSCANGQTFSSAEDSHRASKGSIAFSGPPGVSPSRVPTALSRPMFRLTELSIVVSIRCTVRPSTLGCQVALPTRRRCPLFLRRLPSFFSFFVVNDQLRSFRISRFCVFFLGSHLVSLEL